MSCRVTGCVYLLQYYWATSGTTLLALDILCFRCFPVVVMWNHPGCSISGSLSCANEDKTKPGNVGLHCTRNVNLPREPVVSMLETAAWCKDKQGAISFSGIQSGKERVISQAERPALGHSVGRTSAIHFLWKAPSVTGMLKCQITSEQRRYDLKQHLEQSPEGAI